MCCWCTVGPENSECGEKDDAKSGLYYAALDSALMIGNAILSAGGEGEEAVRAVIWYFESNPLFNAGVGCNFVRLMVPLNWMQQ